MSRKFDRLVISAVLGAVCLTGIASVISPLHGVTAAPRVSFESDEAEVAYRGRPVELPPVVETASLEGGPVSRALRDDSRALRDVRRLANRFEQMGYDLDRVRDQGSPVPRIFLAKLPVDLHAVPEVSLKKTVFFQTLLPLVLQENERILTDRRRLIRLRAEMGMGAKLDPGDRLWLAVLAERYKVPSENVDELLRRVDVVPPSLAMAQAAEESGWGTSRFAQHGNALYGQWTTANGDGLVPLDRDEDMDHKVKRFGSLTQSVSAYMRNLNTHRAYRDFRRARLTMRREGASPDGYELAETLKRYSARGEEYVGSIRSIIDGNALRPLDGARLTEDRETDSAA